MFKNLLQRIRKNRKGQTAIEYALIVGGVSIVAYSMLNSGLFKSFSLDISNMGGKISSELTARTDKLGVDL